MIKGVGNLSLRETSLAGVISFGSEKQWSISGDAGWWVAAFDNKGEFGIRLHEPLAEGFYIQVDAFGRNSDTVENAYCKDISNDGFKLIVPDMSKCNGVAFQLKGMRLEYTPEDRRIEKDKLIEDVHATKQLLAHEAAYGFVSVMCSASIKSNTAAVEEKKEIESKMPVLAQLAASDSDSFKKSARHAQMAAFEKRVKRLELFTEPQVNKYWQSANEFGRLWGEYCTKTQMLALEGRYVPICTGGGPGLMEAVAKGARDVGAQVVGIDAPFKPDEYHDLKNHFSTHSNVRIMCNDFALREAALINYSHVILFWPGGFGTHWELFETLSKIQTNHIRRARTKIFLVHDEYWTPVVEYLKHLRKYGTINDRDDFIRGPGHDDKKGYLAEILKDEKEAFTRTCEHIESLHKQNTLSLN